MGSANDADGMVGSILTLKQAMVNSPSHKRASWFLMGVKPRFSLLIMISIRNIWFTLPAKSLLIKQWDRMM